MLLLSLRLARNISMTVADALEYFITHYLQKLFAVIPLVAQYCVAADGSANRFMASALVKQC